MKKKDKLMMILFLSLAMIMIVVIYFYFSTKQTQLSSDKILQIINPDVNSYCSNLQNAVINSGCPACMYYYSGYKINYILVQNLTEGSSNDYRYTLETKNNNYLVTIKIPTIYGANDKTGSATISFEIDKNGDIINKNASLVYCL